MRKNCRMSAYMPATSSQRFTVFKIPVATNVTTKYCKIYEFYKYSDRRFTSFANKYPWWVRENEES